MIKNLALTLLILIVSLPVFAETPIVYSKCVRYGALQTFTADVPFNGVMESRTRTFVGMDVYDVMPDVANFFTGFTAPCDMVYRDASGVETVIYDCSSNTGPGVTSCAAFEPTVSFDAKKITFAVFKGTLFNDTEHIENRVLDHAADPGRAIAAAVLNNLKLDADGAHLVTYDLDTQQLSESPYEAGVWDAGPAYLSNGKIAFTSTRQGSQTPQVFNSTTFDLSTKIYTVDPDWTNVASVADFSVSQQQHPIQLKKGTIAYSWWRVGGGKAFKYGNGGPGAFDTIHNLFDIFEMSPDGSGNFALYGVHSGDHIHSHIGDSHDAAHFLTETSDGWIWSADYYRRNNNGLGYIVGFLPEPDGQEGIHPSENPNHHGNWYMVRNAIKFNSWSSNNDSASFIMSSPSYTHPSYADPLPYAGKVGHPGALPNNGLMLSWGKGLCSVVGSNAVLSHLGISPIPPMTSGNGEGVLMNILTSTNLDTPGCDIGIYKATVIPSTHPSDLEMIVDSPDWHEIMARAVVPYSAIHGVEKPAVIPPAHTLVTHDELPPGTPYGLFGAGSITDRETHPQAGVHYQNSDWGRKAFGLQGTDTKIYTDDELCGIRILATYPNMRSQFYKYIDNIAGERIAILGEVEIDNRDINGDPVVDPSGHVDTSFLVSLPANVPHFLQAIDCQGRTLNFDQHWSIVTPGERKTCGGCHVHSKPSRITFEQSYANTAEYTIPRLGRGAVPLIDGSSIPGYGLQIEFTQDIKPIFDQHCVSCHGGSSPAAGLALDNTSGANRDAGSTWWCLVKDRFRTCSGEGTPLHRPQLNNYVRAFSAIGSLLYWKAANQRTDGFADEDHPNDIDFGVDHPHTPTITSQELGLISRWIDIGAPGGSIEIDDTQNPTLVLSATVDTGNITELVLGTVDVGDGIDVGTLNVCLRNGSTCTNIAPAAQLHGITTIALGSPITDMNQVVEASVSDMNGNTTTLIHTAQFLVDRGSSEPGTPSTVAINVGSNETVSEGDAVSRTVTFSDGEDTNSDGWTVVVDWNGVTENINVAAGLSSFNISRVMSTAGDVPVTVTITDGAGETAQGSFIITVNSSGGGSGPLVIDTGGDAIIPEGATFTRTISLTDPTDTGNNGWTYTVDWGGLQIHNGSIPTGATSFNITRLMPDGDAIMTVDVTVTDVAGDVSTDSFNLTTLNVNPRGVITGADTVAVNTPYSISLSITDPGDDTISLTSVDWGDSTFNNETSHTYTQPGTYRIKVQVVDEDGVHTVARKTVTVQ